MLACEGPFASAGVASEIAAAMLMPAARAVAAISLRGIGALLPWCLASSTPRSDGRFPHASRSSGGSSAR